MEILSDLQPVPESFNSFISISIVKPLISSGSWLTLHSCEIYQQLIMTSWLEIKFSSGSIVTPCQGRGLVDNFLNHFFYQGHYFPRILTLHNYHRSLLTQGVGEGGLQLILQPFISSGLLFTLGPYPTILAEVTIYPARFLPCFGVY